MHASKVGSQGEEELLSAPVFPFPTGSLLSLCTEAVLRDDMGHRHGCGVCDITTISSSRTLPPTSSLPFGWGAGDLRFLTPSTILCGLHRHGCRQSLIKSPS